MFSFAPSSAAIPDAGSVELGTRHNPDSLIDNYIERTRTDETTSVGRFLGEAALRRVRAEIDTSNGDFQKLNVGFRMTPEEKSCLKANFPGLEIVFKDSCSSSHSFAAAHRVCETKYIYDRFQTTTEKIIDLGGNYVTHAKQKRANVHSCCPVLDVRDGARHQDRYISLAAAVERKHAELPVDFCCSKFEDCNVKAPYAMAVHSISDIPIETLAEHCVRRGVRKLVASVMMDPLMLLYNDGFIPMLNVQWEKRPYVDDSGKIKEEKTMITFHFIDAPGLSYSHDFETLCKYMTTNQVIVNNQYAYRVERVVNLSGVYIIEFTLAMSDGMTLAHLRPLRDVSCSWLSVLRQKVFVKLAIPLPQYSWFQTPFEIRWAALDLQMVRQVSEAAFRQYSPDKEPQKLIQCIATMLSSNSNHVIINGVTMRSGNPIMLEDYVPLAVTFYALTKFRYNMITAGLDALTARTHANVDDITDDGVLEPFDDQSFLSKIGTRMCGYSLQKTSDDAQILLKRNLFKEVVHNVKETLGFTLVGKYEDYLTGMPSHLKATDVWTSFKDNSNLPAEINVKKCVDDLMDKHKSTQVEEQSRLEKEKAFQDARDAALIKLAKVIDKAGDVPDGLKPLVNMMKIEDELKSATVSLTLTPSTINAQDFHASTLKGDVNPYSENIKEAISYIHEVEKTNTRRLKTAGEYAYWKPLTLDGYKALAATDQSLRAFLPMTGKWMGDVSNKSKYERAMTEDGYVSLVWKDTGYEFDENCLKKVMKYHVLLMDDSCVFNSGLRILPALESALKMVPRFKVKIVDGVAGCGKTTYLMNASRMDCASPDLILTSNRSSADELKVKVSCPEAMKSRIRTIDSYLMVNRWFSSKRILMDECFLTHSGFIYAAATLAQAEEVIALGDTEQIPYVSRLPEFKMQFQRITGEIETQTTTYRCPVDVTAALNKFFYKNKVVSTVSKTVSSLETVNINSIVQIPDEDNVLYITHTQADKEKLRSRPGFVNKTRVKTTHEAQGDTWDNVVLFRLSNTTNLLHSGKNPNTGSSHNLVAISRHRKSLRYFTVVPNDNDDEMIRAINYSKTLSDRELDANRLQNRVK